MRGKRRPQELPDWRALASLGEQLAGAGPLSAQQEKIVRMAQHIIGGNVEVWLHEELFRLPDTADPRVFPPRPKGRTMRRAFDTRKLVAEEASPSSRRRVAAVPIEEQGLLLGVMQVARTRGPAFSQNDLEQLTSVAGVAALGLYGSYRAELERFRLGELNLVRRVSAEIAAVLPLDELSRRVCELIQETFRYYYVAIFTLKPGSTKLRFRSSAGALRRGRRRAPFAPEVELRQGLIGQAAASGQIVQAGDVREDPRYRYVEPLHATRSEVVIPLKLEDRVLGVLDVQSDRVEAFHPNDLMLLQALADNVARAVEGAQLYGDLRRRADQLGLLADIGKGAASTLEPSEIMGQAAALIHDRFGFQHVALYTVHPNRGVAVFEAGSGARAGMLPGYSIRLGAAKGIIPWVAREGRTALVNDVARDTRYRPSPMPPKNTSSELAIPLIHASEVLGVLDIQSDKPNAFSQDDALMLEAAADTIAAAMRNANLFRSEQWRRQVADGLREVAGRLSEHVGIDEALEAILSELGRNLPVDVSAIWLIDQGRPRLAAVRGAEASDVRRALAGSPVLRSQLEQASQADLPVLRQPKEALGTLGKVAGFGRDYSGVTAPMRAGDQPVGIIGLAHHEAGRYGHEAQVITSTLASYGAVAIENARLYDAAQDRAQASAALLQVAEVVAGPLDMRHTLSTIVAMAPRLLNARSCSVYAWDSGQRRYAPIAEAGLVDHIRAAIWDKPVEAGEFPLLDAARNWRRTVYQSLDPAASTTSWAELASSKRTTQDATGPNPLLIAEPMLLKQDVVGVLLVEEGEEPSQLRSRRFEIIHGMGQQMAMAIQADLLQREMVARERLETEVELARQIQTAFIPQVLPHRDGWELAARWETARQVGGDFYDVVELPGARLGLFIADVSDKGMPAALFMALTRTLFRAAVAEGARPAQALRRINDLLIPDTRQGMFVTAVYGVLDPATGTFTYANAGHNPPIWLHDTGAVQELGRTALPLGVIDQTEVQERQLQLERGDSILCYTDGVTEAFAPDGSLFGEERLLAAVGSKPRASAEDLLHIVETRLRRFMRTLPLADDLTMLAMHRL
jgi:sigma-B regulation protein RsbU (phosphoserine phosphatase)